MGEARRCGFEKDGAVCGRPAGHAGYHATTPIGPDLVATAPMDLELLETGWLMAALWERAGAGDPIARSLYLKMKHAAISMGVVWYYGDPWPEAAESA